MTVNLLSKRLKDAKRELTNLKTAHTRGLGNLRIFSQRIDLDPTGHELNFWYIIIDIEFDHNYAEYPFAQATAGIDPVEKTWSAEPESITYTSGYHAIFQFFWALRTDNASYCFIASSSPIVNISIEWRSA